MTDFQGIGVTPWEQMSTSEVRHFARGLSGSGVAADARAIGSAGNSHADSLAELQRDTAVLSERWRGEAKDRSYVEFGDFTSRSYSNAVALFRLVGNVEELSGTATETNERFSDLPDPPSRADGWSPSAGSDYRNVVAEQVRSTYSSPVQTSASTLPLGEAQGTTVFHHIGPGNTKRDAAGSAAPTAPGSVSPTDGSGSGGGTQATGAGAADTGTDPDDTATTGADATSDGASDATTGTGTGAGSGTGTGAGGGTGTGGQGAGAALDTGAGADPTAVDGADDPRDEIGTPSSLLSPSAAVPLSSANRTGAGLSGLGGRGDAGRTATPPSRPRRTWRPWRSSPAG
ncbi:hypothetical protein [Tsukamurella columbiensis]|uniref:PPE family protein n=1 Tax=Tsukamurella columbiensis TaxID=128509 RepID=A0ABX1LPK9_9ACTN|nr:hypothetical protein [Tsukamurella columbiensis]NMD58041.1 hypothetical protein [Tsukamurella columbiensis]